ncbi:DNA ligase D [Lysinibacillus sp. CD3-6]|uniref:DNA ligase D n=1 Tax=Lysinibacillus sp. CD3-6 TaxID=2892541 RepID=UPI00116CD96D|nr:DNA ligase D [Lysinibacillus sp. CD3-6]UED82429.1 DNA ligase D [Lysinibacillus sp. CD3-6]
MKPMLLTEAIEPPKGEEWFYEAKYDGFRCIIQWTEEEPILISRNGNVLNQLFPEIIAYCKDLYKKIKAYLPLTFDGELVFLMNNYKSEFSIVQQRGRMQNKEVIAAHAKSFPCHYVVFDLLQFKGESQANRYLKTRKQQLTTLFTKLKLSTTINYEDNRPLQAIDVFEDTSAIWHLITTYNGEGLIAKKKTSKWQEDVRTNQWMKIKNWRMVTVIVTKYDKGNGYFQGCVYRQGELTEVVVFRHGMKNDELNTLIAFFKANGIKQNETWELEPSICVDIACIDFDGKKLREPRFHAFRLEMDPQECNWQQMHRQLMPIPESVQVTHPNKPVWPEIGITKDSYLHYLQFISPLILPLLRQRPVTLIRFPHGVSGESFYQKSSPDNLPEFVATEKVSEHHGILCNNLETLLWLGNQLALEIHIPFQTIDTDKPTEIVFDLDPPNVDAFSLAISAARHLKEIFDYFKLQSFVKTSGGKGLQVYIPLPYNTFSYEQVRQFTEFVCRFLCEQKTGLYTIERLKKNRNDRLYLDYVQHAEGKTIISPFSTRGNPMGLVATPLYWDEVNEQLRPELFTIPTVIERIKRVGNPFRNFEAIGEEQDFHAVLQHLTNQ